MEQLTLYIKTFWSRITGAAHVSNKKMGRKIGLRPNQDWLIILGFLGVGFIISAGIAFWVYTDVQNGGFVTVLPAQSVSQSPTLNAQQLQTVENYFATKQNIVATSTPDDPSK